MRQVPRHSPLGGDNWQAWKHAAHALAAEIYLEGGIRAGVFDEIVRLAVPRRVYTRDHLEHVGEVVGRVYRREPMKLKCVHRPEEFSNFFARFKPR